MSDTYRLTVPISKRDTAQQLVFGFANVSVSKDGDLVTDLHGDQILPEVLEKAAYNFVLDARVGGREHETMGVARLVESVFLTEDKLKAMGIKDDTFKGAAWFLGFKVDDADTWAAVEKGELCAFSIGGEALVETVGEDAK